MIISLGVSGKELSLGDEDEAWCLFFFNRFFGGELSTLRERGLSRFFSLERAFCSMAVLQTEQYKTRNETPVPSCSIYDSRVA